MAECDANIKGELHACLWSVWPFCVGLQTLSCISGGARRCVEMAVYCGGCIFAKQRPSEDGIPEQRPDISRRQCRLKKRRPQIYGARGGQAFPLDLLQLGLFCLVCLAQSCSLLIGDLSRV